MSKPLSRKHRKDLERYVAYYKGQEEIYGDSGWPSSIAHAIEAALARLDELEKKARDERQAERDATRESEG